MFAARAPVSALAIARTRTVRLDFAVRMDAETLADPAPHRTIVTTALASATPLRAAKLLAVSVARTDVGASAAFATSLLRRSVKVVHVCANQIAGARTVAQMVVAGLAERADPSPTAS